MFKAIHCYGNSSLHKKGSLLSKIYSIQMKSKKCPPKVFKTQPLQQGHEVVNKTLAFFNKIFSYIT